MFGERLLGDTLQEIGEQHDLSIERVRQVIAVHATRHLNELEMALLVARNEGLLSLRSVFRSVSRIRTGNSRSPTSSGLWAGRDGRPRDRVSGPLARADWR